MSLIKHKDMNENFLVFASISLSPYVFPGMENQETSVSFIFLNIPKLGKRQSCVSEHISVKVYTNVQCLSCNA